MSHRRIGLLVSPAVPIAEDPLAEVAAALDELGYDPVVIPADAELDRSLRDAGLDAVFLALDDRRTRDGSVQGLLELRGLPYTGPGVCAAAIAFDRMRTRELLRLHNLPVPAYYVHRRGHGSVEEQHGAFGMPVVIRTRSAEPNRPLRRVATAARLGPAMAAALKHDDHVVVERFVPGTVVRCVLMGDLVVGMVEVIPAEDGSDLVALPPRASTERLRGASALCAQAVRKLGTGSLAEVEVVLCDRGNELIVDVNLLPRIDRHSVVGRVLAATGTPLTELVAAMLHEAGLHASRRAPFIERRRRPRPEVPRRPPAPWRSPVA